LPAGGKKKRKASRGGLNGQEGRREEGEGRERQLGDSTHINAHRSKRGAHNRLLGQRKGNTNIHSLRKEKKKRGGEKEKRRAIARLSTAQRLKGKSEFLFARLRGEAVDNG